MSIAVGTRDSDSEIVVDVSKERFTKGATVGPNALESAIDGSVESSDGKKHPY